LVGDRSYWSQSGNGGLYPYIRQRGLKSIWCCPLLREWCGKYPARSYSMNSYLRTPSDVEYYDCVSFLRGVNVARIQRPTETVLLYEGIPLSTDFQDKVYTEDQIYYIYRCANWAWARGYPPKIVHTVDPGRPWHGRFNNYLYCDGHVVARQPGRPMGGGLTLSTYREMREW
jgi:prepilin-type processing-associated H-X9-DG protein